MIRNKKIILKVEIRRLKVKELIAKGLSSEQIAEQMNVSPITIRRDFQTIRKAFTENLSEEVNFTIFKIDLGYQEANKAAWKILDESKDEHVKLKSLKTISHILSERANLLLKVGGFDSGEKKSDFDQIVLDAFNAIQKTKPNEEKKEFLQQNQT